MVNVALVAPAGTVTGEGTLAEPGRLLAIVTAVPPAGAALGSVTRPDAFGPPGTLAGVTVKPVRVGAGGGVPAGFTVSTALFVTPPPEIEIVTSVCVETVCGRICTSPRVLPAGIVTLWARNGSTVGLSVVTCRI